MIDKPVILLVLDGWGIAPDGPGNAIALAQLPNFKRLLSNFPHSKLQASGEAVGLPHGEAGNTETGHLNLGAGHIVYQDLPRIDMAIADGTFYQNQAFLDVAAHVKQNNSRLHIMGLIGSGGVHANIEHLFALLRFTKEQGLSNVFVHLFTDGRDSPPTSALEYIRRVKEELQKLGVGAIASVMGRYYAMDRDQRWDRTEKAYLALTKGTVTGDADAEEVVKKFYDKGITDEFIEPTSLAKNGQPLGLIGENDGVIFYNFRIDRPRQLTKAFVLDDLAQGAKKSSFDPYSIRYISKHEAETPVTPVFNRGPKLKNLFFVTMTEFEKNLPVLIAFPPQWVKYPLGRAIADAGLRQLRLTESEKERFVTFYFNGQREVPFPLEERLIIPSLKVPTYDLTPQMRMREITTSLIESLSKNIYNFMLVNLPGADMLGHTGVLPAAIKACEVIDECLGKISYAVLLGKATLFITADHGNAEEMIEPTTGAISTEHTHNPVPYLIVSRALQGKSQILEAGILADVAPTILNIMGLNQPTEMTGRNLLKTSY